MVRDINTLTSLVHNEFEKYKKNKIPCNYHHWPGLALFLNPKKRRKIQQQKNCQMISNKVPDNPPQKSEWQSRKICLTIDQLITTLIHSLSSGIFWGCQRKSQFSGIFLDALASLDLLIAH